MDELPGTAKALQREDVAVQDMHAQLGQRRADCFRPCALLNYLQWRADGVSMQTLAKQLALLNR